VKAKKYFIIDCNVFDGNDDVFHDIINDLFGPSWWRETLEIFFHFIFPIFELSLFKTLLEKKVNLKFISLRNCIPPKWICFSGSHLSYTYFALYHQSSFVQLKV